MQVSIDGKDGRNATISAPYDDNRVASLPARLTLPAHRAAVVAAE